jgi:hypothetical protein
MKKRKKANPMLTRTGKPRLKPLNLAQLNDMLQRTTKKKEKMKIESRIKVLLSRQKSVVVSVAETVE